MGVTKPRLEHTIWLGKLIDKIVANNLDLSNPPFTVHNFFCQLLPLSNSLSSFLSTQVLLPPPGFPKLHCVPPIITRTGNEERKAMEVKESGGVRRRSIQLSLETKALITTCYDDGGVCERHWHWRYCERGHRTSKKVSYLCLSLMFLYFRTVRWCRTSVWAHPYFKSGTPTFG